MCWIVNYFEKFKKISSTTHVIMAVVDYKVLIKIGMATGRRA